jgi:hypothetical protein
MKEKIATALRHALTSLPAAGGYLLARGWLAAEEAAELDALQGQALAGLAAIAAAGAARFILLGVAKWAPGLQGVFGAGQAGQADSPSSAGGTGGMTPAWVVVGTAAALMAGGLLPSCTALEDMMVAGQACYILDDGSKVCLTGDQDGRARVSGRIAIRDPGTGEVTGWIEATAAPVVRAEK